MQSTMLRSFVAIKLPGEVQQAIAESTAGLQRALPKPLVRWVPPRNMHLTLKFFGDVSPANLERLAEALRTEAAVHSVFPVSVGGLGAFPNPRRARILWIGLEAPPALPALQRALEAAAALVGYAPEDRNFSPHLTIGRVGQSVTAGDLQKIRTQLEATKVGPFGTFQVESVDIFKSDLQPGGSVYTQLYSLPMRKP
jgi:2'-5' RNA ligase